jgi:hypothetical protein
MIECNRLITCQIKTGTVTSTPQILDKYPVIGVYKKSYNKWFMAKENKKPRISLSQQDRKKYKVTIRMVEDVDAESLMLNDCQDVSAHDARFKVISAKIFMGMRFLMYCHSCISTNKNVCECELYVNKYCLYIANMVSICLQRRNNNYGKVEVMRGV